MDVHYVKTGKEYDIAFFPESKRFFRINDKARNIIDSILSNEDIENIANREKVSVERIKQYQEKVMECLANTKSGHKEQIENSLKRLVIHLANGCNLRCLYCYANGGVYHSNTAFIENRTIDRIFEIFYGQFDFIESIQLFGGEPLLNMDAIEYVCKKIERICEGKERKTNIGLVTNGTLINDRFIDLVNQYNLQVTISYDGNEIVNDMLRIDTNNNGTSKLILEKARLLKEKTGQPNTIEVTYTQYHYDNNVSLIDIVKHIYNHLGTIGIHCVPAGGKDDLPFILEKYDPFIQGVNDTYEANKEEPEKKYSYSFVQRITNGIATRSTGSRSICDAGNGTISVSVDGTIYPCFMFTDMEEYKLGNVYDAEPLKSKEMFKVLNEFRKVNRKNSEECDKCFARNLCTGCLGLNLINTGDIATPDTKYCDMIRDITEHVLIKLAEK